MSEDEPRYIVPRRFINMDKVNYIQWFAYTESMQYVNWICGKIVSLHQNVVYCGKWSVQNEKIHQFSIRDVKMLLLTGKIGKAFGVWDFCVFMINKIPAIIFKLGGWHTAKTGACFCFSSVFVRQKPGCLSRLTSLGEFWVLVKLA